MSWLPSSDIPFKAIFGTENHSHILRGLLNAVFASSKLVLKEVQVTNADVAPDLLSDIKNVRLSIGVRA